MQVLIQTAAGVIVGGGILWLIAFGMRFREHRFCAFAGFFVAFLIISAVLLNSGGVAFHEPAGCGANDPLCIRD